MTRPIVFDKRVGSRQVVPAAPMARQHYASKSSPETVARQLNELQRTMAKAVEASSAIVPSKYVTLEVLPFVNVTIMRHGFGREARWRVVDWRPGVPNQTCTVQSVKHDDEANTLICLFQRTGRVTMEIS